MLYSSVARKISKLGKIVIFFAGDGSYGIMEGITKEICLL